MIRKIFVLLIALLVSCTTASISSNISPYDPKDLGAERKFEKNYTLGTKNIVYVGEPMIRVRDYVVSKSTLPQVVASSNSTISGGPDNIKIVKNNIYKILGVKNIDNIKYRVINVPNETDNKFSYGVVISDEGRIQGDVILITENLTVPIYRTFTASNDLKFIDTNDVEMIPTPGQTNYELIYSGKDSESFFIKYREFTGDDLAREAFFQELTYSINSKKIRFKNIEIVVDEVTNEQIVFTVVSDGLQN